MAPVWWQVWSSLEQVPGNLLQTPSQTPSQTQVWSRSWEPAPDLVPDPIPGTRVWSGLELTFPTFPEKSRKRAPEHEK